jgi:hypothetical protein
VTDPLLVRRSQLGPLQLLGNGGTALVYRAPRASLPGVAAVVYKEYKAPIRASAGPSLLPGLRALVAFRQQLDPALRPRWDERIIWPLRVVVADHDPTAAVGVLMRLIPARFFQRVVSRMTGAIGVKVREVDALFGDTADMARIGYPTVDIRRRIALVGRIAEVYGVMHKQNVVVGDISARNVVYDVSTASPTVIVLDADSCRIAGSAAAFGNQPQTPLWEPPEAVRASRQLEQASRRGRRLSTSESMALLSLATGQSVQTDVYKFGLMVVRILDFGRRRAVNYDPTVAGRILRQHTGVSGENLLLRSLSDERRDRPAIREWHDLTHGGSMSGTSIRPVVYVRGRGWVRRP